MTCQYPYGGIHQFIRLMNLNLGVHPPCVPQLAAGHSRKAGDSIPVGPMLCMGLSWKCGIQEWLVYIGKSF